MTTTARRSAAALVLSLCALLAAAVVASPPGRAADRQGAPVTTAATNQQVMAQSACPDRSNPPPAIDTSENVVPGSSTPTPLAVPKTAVGGGRMGECTVVLPPGAPKPPDTAFASWVLADMDSGAVLAAKDPHARERPASLIKILLALVVVREMSLDTVVTGTQEDADQEGTRVGIGPGGRYTVDQLLHALVMHSGNDVAHSLAVAMGSVQITVDKMNALAKELGALDTRAATPSGLDGPGMSTSAYDLALIFRAAMHNPHFADAVNTRSMPMPGYGDKPGFTVTNDNQLLATYPGDLGGKTGFTDDATHTYANAAQRNGHKVMLIMLRNDNHLDGMYSDGKALMDYGFTLAEAHTSAVGQLVDRAPDTSVRSPSNAGPAAPVTTGSSGPTDGSQQASGQQSSAFGNVGGPLTAGAAVLVLAGGLLYWRKRRSRRPTAS